MREAAGSRIFVVFRKEIREMFRDKRSLFNTVLSPLLITPLILALMGTVIKKQVEEAKAETIAVGVVGRDRAPALMAILQTAPNVRFEPVTRPEAEARIRGRKLKAAVVLPEDADRRLAEMRPVPIAILLDEGSGASNEAAERIKGLFAERGQRVVAERLRSNGMSQEVATPFQVKREPIRGGGSAATAFLSGFLPYLLAIYAILGGVSAANDSVAGEKERGTLETLLVSPASRRDLVLGKFLAIGAMALTSSVCSVVGLLWPFYVGHSAFDWMVKGGLTLGPTAIAAILLVQIPLAVLGAGVLLAVSTYARNQKEAQTYLAPVLVLVSIAAMMSMLLKAESGLQYAAVPILNAALVLKQALESSFNAPFVALACLTSLLYAGLALWFATYLFTKESVLLKA